MPEDKVGELSSKSGRYKLAAELTQEQFNNLRELQELAGVNSKKELLDNAFTILTWALHKSRDGQLICAMDSTGAVSQLEMAVLTNARSTTSTKAETPASTNL